MKIKYKHRIYILWSEPDQDIETYAFKTKCELEAFIKGCEAANGYMNYQPITKDQYYKLKPEFDKYFVQNKSQEEIDKSIEELLTTFFLMGK